MYILVTLNSLCLLTGCTFSRDLWFLYQLSVWPLSYSLHLSAVDLQPSYVSDALQVIILGTNSFCQAYECVCTTTKYNRVESLVGIAIPRDSYMIVIKANSKDMLPPPKGWSAKASYRVYKPRGGGIKKTLIFCLWSNRPVWFEPAMLMDSAVQEL